MIAPTFRCSTVALTRCFGAGGSPTRECSDVVTVGSPRSIRGRHLPGRLGAGAALHRGLVQLHRLQEPDRLRHVNPGCWHRRYRARRDVRVVRPWSGADRTRHGDGLYPTLLDAIGAVAYPIWHASSSGIYRLWRDMAYAVDTLLASVAATRIDPIDPAAVQPLVVVLDVCSLGECASGHVAGAINMPWGSLHQRAAGSGRSNEAATTLCSLGFNQVRGHLRRDPCRASVRRKRRLTWLVPSLS